MKRRQFSAGAIPTRQRVAPAGGCWSKESNQSVEATDESDCHSRTTKMPLTEEIILEETDLFASAAAHRATTLVINRLRRRLHAPKQAELERLFHKLPQLDNSSRTEIEQFADRLVNKMLHPLLESLSNASKNGTPTGLLESLRRLFMIED